MNLTPEQQTVGRRNFLKAVAGVPALAGLGVAAATRGPVAGGPVRVGFVGLGGEGRVLLAQVDPAFAEVKALCDINPAQLMRADEVLAKTGKPKATHYADYKEMLAKEDIEGVIIATPLWAHADQTVTCLEAGKHVLCEKMMAWDVEGCERMRQAGAAHRARARDRLSAVLQPDVPGGVRGHHQGRHAGRHLHGAHRLAPQRQLAPRRRPAHARLQSVALGLQGLGAPAQLAALQAVLARAARRTGQPPGEHRQLVLRRRCPRSCTAAAASIAGRTAARSTTTCMRRSSTRADARRRSPSIESNAFDHFYEAFFGTKGTLVLKGETEAYLFEEGGGDTSDRHRSVRGGRRPGARSLREPRRRCRGTVQQRDGGRRRPAGFAIDTRSPGSARPSARARRWPAAPTKRSGRPWRACAPSTPSSRRRASPSRRSSVPSRHAIAR